MFATRFALAATVLIGISSLAQDASTYAIERQQALQLYRAGKLEQALPLLEKLASENPADSAIQEGLGIAAISRNATEPDPNQRKQWCEKGRAALLKAKTLGDDSNLVQNVLSGIPENCEQQYFSTKNSADDIMRSAEAAFARGDLDAALAGYEQALLLDPKLYSAALFAGDVYFKKGEQGSAGQWYARAIDINPDVETAYRYWGDALMAQGRVADARDKYVDAVVAEPYQRRSWTGIMQWAQREKLSLNRVQIQPASSFAVDSKGNNTITLDPTKVGDANGGAAWIGYGGSRALYRTEKFPKQHPGEKYRHTLEEETEALTSVATIAEELQKSGKAKDLDPQLVTLVKLKEDGLIEAYVLLGAPDQDIAQDYDAYRQKNRDKLHQYLSTYVVPPAP